jgi:crotonobetainyl-CoA:carnitine CoA-transferase CaiB-like acyl-CoA transferase
MPVQPLPLAGIRVVDFSGMIAGPYCTRWLADMGAQVTKVEPPEGDHMRQRPPLRDGHSAFFGHLNAGKRCVSLDLKRPAAVDAALRVVDGADVIVEAFRPGVMDRLGLGPAALRARDKRLVYCSISGFGQDTDWSARPAYAPIVHAASGFDLALGRHEDGRPLTSSMPLADVLTAMFALASIQSALLRRAATGEGTHIDVNLMDSVLNVMPYEFQAAQASALQPRPSYQPMRASDGWVLVTPINARNFRNLCLALGHPEWLEDPLLATDAARFANWAEYMRRIEDWTRLRPAAECESVFAAHGVPCSVFRELRDAMHDAQFRQRGSFAGVGDDAGSYLTTRLPFAFDGVRPEPGARVAALGEHTLEVLREAGVDDAMASELARTSAQPSH